MKILSILTLCFLLFLNSIQGVAQNLTHTHSNELDRLIQTQQHDFDIPGFAVGIIKDEEVFYTNTSGVQTLNTTQTMSSKSLFHMASVSKPFVATAIVQLMEQGKLNLDDKLIDHLPYFKMQNTKYRKITIRQMLSHTSGIPDVEDYEWDKPQYDKGAAERFAKSFVSSDLDFSPGKRFNYSNAAFDILAAVISNASGMTFEEYMKKYIFEPVGMVNSTFSKPEVPEELATSPHIFDKNLQRVVSEVYPYNRRHAPSSTLHSNVEDMLLWAKVNMNKGIINDKRIYSESSYKLLTSAEKKIGKTRQVCLSWFVSEVNGTPAYNHSGGDLGYSTFFAFLPEKKAAIVLMANVDGFWSSYAASTIMKKVLFDEEPNWQGPIHYKLKDYILTEGIEKCKEIYREELEKSPQQYDMDNGSLDDLGYWLLENGHKEKALEVFLFNTELQPKHPGWVDSVGDAYSAMGNKRLAIEWYRKALEINPKQDFSRKKLDELLEAEK